MTTTVSSPVFEQVEAKEAVRLKRGKPTPITHGFSGHPVVYNGVVATKHNNDGTVSLRLLFTQHQPARGDIQQYVTVKFVQNQHSSQLASKGKEHVVFYGATDSTLRIDVIGIEKDEHWITVQPSQNQ